MNLLPDLVDGMEQQMWSFVIQPLWHHALPSLFYCEFAVGDRRINICRNKIKRVSI